MSYLPSVALLVAGAVLLGVLVLRSVRRLRRFNRTTTMVLTNTKDRVGLLRARIAAVRVAVARRGWIDGKRAGGEVGELSRAVRGVTSRMPG